MPLTSEHPAETAADRDATGVADRGAPSVADRGATSVANPRRTQVDAEGRPISGHSPHLLNRS